MPIEKIRDDIYWVGVKDPELQYFDITIKTEHGTSYNAYLVKGKEKTALIDTVKADFFEEYLANIRQLADLSTIDYLVVNHSEPDHAGSIEKLLDLIPGLLVVAHPTALGFIREICNREFNAKAVNNRDQLDLGGKTLSFMTAMLLHWPDTIYTYVPEDKVLFTCDSFGAHYCGGSIFADLLNLDLSNDLKYYFDNIMKPFKSNVIMALNKLKHYELEVICPGHGPIIRNNIDHYLELYREWASPQPNDSRPKIVLAYLSAYGYTAMLADSIEKGLLSEHSFNYKRFDLAKTSVEEIAAEIDDADGLIVGSPTLNKDTLPVVWQLLACLSPITHAGMLASAFGVYGWSGEAVHNISQRMLMLRMHVLPGFRVKFKPTGHDLARAVDFGRSFAEVLMSPDAVARQAKLIPKVYDFKHLTKKDYVKTYASDDLIIHWNPDLCMHDSNCYTNLLSVFNPDKRPWVNMNGASLDEIIRTINHCPSGALRYSLPEGSSLKSSDAHGSGLLED